MLGLHCGPSSGAPSSLIHRLTAEQRTALLVRALRRGSDSTLAAEAAQLVAASRNIHDLPSNLLVHILLYASDSVDLLRHACVCAMVHPGWRQVLLDTAAYGFVAQGATLPDWSLGGRVRLLTKLRRGLRYIMSSPAATDPEYIAPVYESVHWWHRQVRRHTLDLSQVNLSGYGTWLDDDEDDPTWKPVGSVQLTCAIDTHPASEDHPWIPQKRLSKLLTLDNDPKHELEPLLMTPEHFQIGDVGVSVATTMIARLSPFSLSLLLLTVTLLLGA
jgi:hypothetical protein